MSRIQTLLNHFPNYAITNPQGEILLSKNTFHFPLSSISNLTQIHQMISQLGPGDIAITNEVSSFTSGLHQFIMTYGLQFGSKELCFLHISMEFPKVFPLDKKIESEFLRLPPLPIVVKNQIQQDLISNICSHPLAPKGLKDRFLEQIQTFLSLGKTLDSLSQYDLFSDLRWLLKASNKSLQIEMDSLELFETHSKVTLATGETLEGKFRVSEEGFFVDFKGTSLAQKLFIPAHVTQSASLQAFKDFFFPKLTLDHNWFKYLNLRLPDSFLNCKTLPTQSLCAYYGYQLVYGFIIQSLAKNPRRLRGASPLIPAYLVSPQEAWSLEIPSSLGAVQSPFSNATEEKNYTPFLTWNDSVIDQLLKSTKTLTLKKMYPRLDRHGKGSIDGSFGTHLEFEAHQDTEVLFISEPALHQIRSPKQGPSDICEAIMNHQKEHLITHSQTLSLKKNEALDILSAGGGALVI